MKVPLNFNQPTNLLHGWWQSGWEVMVVVVITLVKLVHIESS